MTVAMPYEHLGESHLLGGNGILLDNHVIRHMTDIEVLHSYERTETIQTLIVERDITGVGAFA
jgi:glutaryl-CoA dehydrogenase